MTTAVSRAGRYVQQLTGYRAFIPKPLPPEPPLIVDYVEVDYALAEAFVPNLRERLLHRHADAQKRQILARMRRDRLVEIGDDGGLDHQFFATAWTMPFLRRMSAASLK